MEAGTIMKMVEDAFCHHFFIIDVIVSDDYSTMRSVPKHQSIGVQVLKSTKGKIDEEIPVPSFLADLSHRVRVNAKNISSFHC